MSKTICRIVMDVVWHFTVENNNVREMCLAKIIILKKCTNITDYFNVLSKP